MKVPHWAPAHRPGWGLAPDWGAPLIPGVSGGQRKKLETWKNCSGQPGHLLAEALADSAGSPAASRKGGRLRAGRERRGAQPTASQYCSLWGENLWWSPGKGGRVARTASTCPGHGGGGRCGLWRGGPVGGLGVNETSWSLRWGGQRSSGASQMDSLVCRDGGSPLPRPPGGLTPRRHFQG